MRSSSGDAVGVELGSISFHRLVRVLRALPGVSIGKVWENPTNDEASASFAYKGVKFQVETPLSDYWIDRPPDCPHDVFEEIVVHLQNFHVRWWHRIF